MSKNCVRREKCIVNITTFVFQDDSRGWRQMLFNLTNKISANEARANRVQMRDATEASRRVASVEHDDIVA